MRSCIREIYEETLDMNKRFLIILAIGSTMLTSCFKDEPLNAECDIEEAYVHTDDVGSMFFNATDTIVRVPSDQTDIVFEVRQNADLSNLAPILRITEGATVSPESGSAHDFSKGAVAYTVKSADKQWSRTYNISFKPVTRTSNEEMAYDFENYSLDSSGKYYCWTDLDSDGNALNNWATANSGFKLSKGSALPDEYPTIPTEGVDGMGVALVTRSTGSFGAMVKRPLAAGNLFIGTFDISKALTETMKATRFGLPFDMRPLTFSGYYRYTPGETFTDSEGNVVEGRTDASTIYAVLYRNHDADGNSIVLYGDDVQTSPNLVAMARLDINETVTEWTYFEIAFEYYEEVDFDLLEQRGYSLGIVCSSSSDGNLYMGAVGSTLMVDKFRIKCEKREE